jgi:16S rRNA (guanine527-N7)-methyltransferase
MMAAAPQTKELALWQTQLQHGLAEMGLSFTSEQQHQLLEYLALLQKWNRVSNLTAVRDPAEMVPRHLLDSLSILGLLQGERILDIGTGPGLPGIPLAIASPQRRFTLLDSNGKKCRFVQQAKLNLALEKVEVAQSRVEAFAPEEGFDTITSRALASLPQIVEWSRHLLKAEGAILAMKGSLPHKEMQELEDGGAHVETLRLQVPMTNSERHAILITFPVAAK